MPQAASRDPIYRRRRYSAQLIEQCVRWYLTYRLSYRDLTAMMAEREVTVSHTTIMRWVRHYVPEYERRWSRFSKPTHSSWPMDETSVSVGGRWNYLYRAVDRNGKSVHSLLREDRTIGSAQEFLRQAVKVKGLKSFPTAAVTFLGIELGHRIRKRQFTLAYERQDRTRSLKDLWDQALSGKSFLDSLDTSPPPLMHQISRRSRRRQRARRGSNGVVRSRRKGALRPQPLPSGYADRPPVLALLLSL